MDTEYESSRIERAKRGLYRPLQEGAAPKDEYHQELSPTDIEVASDWGDTTIISERKESKNYGALLLKIVVIIAMLSTLASGGYLLYQMLTGVKPSDKNIIISFDVPVGVTPGTPADITIKVQNQNQVGLEYSNLTVVYPSGTRSGDDVNKDLRDQKKVLGDIPAGGEVEFHTKAIFLGEENSDKELHASLEFRFKNINSVFTKDDVRQVHLSASPVNLSVDTLKELNSGQDITLSLNALSNTVIPLRDILIKVEYPLGFTYVDAEPKPTFGNNVWRIGTMNPASKLGIKIHGVLVGEDTQETVFRTAVGVGADQTARDIATMYNNVLSSVRIQRPFIGIELLINGKHAEDAVAQFGSRVTGKVNWTNNLSTKVTNAQIEVHLSGVALDRVSVIPGQGGFFRSSDNTIFWDERGDKTLADIEQGGSGYVTFSFLPMPSVTNNKLITNPVITADVTVRGKHFSVSGVPEEIKTEITKDVKVTSQAQVVPHLMHFVGPIANSGPIPPKVDQETTYTVLFDVINTSNAIKNASITGVIPSYVSWGGAISPANADITFNRSNNTVTWNIGDIPAGTGVNTPPREAAFQLVFLPSLSQVGDKPYVLQDITFEGTDSFTGQTITQKKSPMTTLLDADPKAADKSEFVVQ
jgi:hypothetical protein